MRLLRRRRTGRHPLAGSGPIVDRARQALARVAAQFGEIESRTDTEFRVRTPEGIAVTLSYAPGDYVFSRVYNLTITAELPSGSRVPSGIALSHRDRSGSRFVRGSDFRAGSAVSVSDINAQLTPHLPGVDLLAARIRGDGANRSITVTPLGGSYVWVLIPPVFQLTAFPQGEPERLLALISDARALGTTAADHTPPRPHQ